MYVVTLTFQCVAV